jgi:hypothetical protein
VIPVQKDRAGSCSLGYEWKTDGAIVEVEDAHAAELVHIPDGGFRIVFPEPEPDAPEVPEAAKAPVDEVQAAAPVAEPAPAVPAQADAIPAAAVAEAPSAVPAAARAKPAASRAKSAKAEA